MMRPAPSSISRTSRGWRGGLHDFSWNKPAASCVVIGAKAQTPDATDPH
ncbi:hypothetical protein [Prosthecobacter sp.]